MFILIEYFLFKGEVNQNIIHIYDSFEQADKQAKIYAKEYTVKFSSNFYENTGLDWIKISGTKSKYASIDYTGDHVNVFCVVEFSSKII